MPVVFVHHLAKPLKVNLNVTEEAHAAKAAASSECQEELHDPRPSNSNKDGARQGPIDNPHPPVNHGGQWE